MRAIVLLAAALSHSFYDYSCCSDRDCHPIADRHVRHVATGYAVSIDDQHYVVPDSAVRVSPDGRFHVCINGGRLICFYAPPMGA